MLIGGLEAARDYTFQVSAVGLLGESALSPPSLVVRTAPLDTGLAGEHAVPAQPQGAMLVQRSRVRGKGEALEVAARWMRGAQAAAGRCLTSLRSSAADGGEGGAVTAAKIDEAR